MASSALAATPSTVLPCYSISEKKQTQVRPVQCRSPFIRIYHYNSTLVVEMELLQTLSWIVRSNSALRSISTTSILASSAAMCRAVWDLWSGTAWDGTHALSMERVWPTVLLLYWAAGTLSVALMSHPAVSRQWMTGMWLFFTARWRGASWSWQYNTQI